MSRQIAVGKALQELQNRIKIAYGKDYKVKVTGVIIEVKGLSTPAHEVILRPNEVGGEDPRAT